MSDGVEYGNFLGWNFDFLLENKMTAFGSGTFEAAYYHYAVSNNVLNDNAGDAYLLFAGWLMPHEVGCCGFCGRFRPYVRYQKYDRDNKAFAASLGDAKSKSGTLVRSSSSKVTTRGSTCSTAIRNWMAVDTTTCSHRVSS